jgi:hypothetical protein
LLSDRTYVLKAVSRRRYQLSPMLRPKTSHAASFVSPSASLSWQQNTAESSFDGYNSLKLNLEDADDSASPFNRRAHSASSRLVSESKPFSNSSKPPVSVSRNSAGAFLAVPADSPFSSLSRPPSSISRRSVKLRPQSGSTNIDAEALLQSSAYHGVPISKRVIANDSSAQVLHPIMLHPSGKSHDVYVRNGDSVVMFDEESVRFTSFVNSVEVSLAQLPPPNQSSIKDRVVMACNIIEKLCVFQTPAQRLMKLIKNDIYRGIWQHYEPPAPQFPEFFEKRRGYFEDCLGVAGVLQTLTQQTNDALAQAASLRTSCKQKDHRIADLEAVVASMKQENIVMKEKEGGFQEIFARSLVRMRSDQSKRIEVEKELRDMQLKVTSFAQLLPCFT